MLFFDIETERLPLARLQEIMPPFDGGKLKHPGEFDQDAVKLPGNPKDPIKIDKGISAARAKHEKAVEDFQANWTKAETDYWAGIVDKAALSAMTGRVLVIGVFDDQSGKVDLLCPPEHVTDPADYNILSETVVLEKFWDLAAEAFKGKTQLAGLNIFGFDLPFLVRRSWILEVEIPPGIFTRGKYPNWNPGFVDLRVEWQLGDQQAKSSFDELGRAFGTDGKPDGVSGKDFSRLWWSDREKAITYLINDLKQPADWAVMMGLL